MSAADAKFQRPDSPSAELVQAFVQTLKRGRCNALTATQIADHLRIAGGAESRKRIVRHLAEHAANAGALFCADNSGYYIPEHQAETEETKRRFRSQIALMQERLRRMEAAERLEFPPEQLRLGV